MKYVSLRTNISSVDNAYTSITVSAPGGQKIIGGGASLPNGTGHLLCQSNPISKTTWQAASRAHGYLFPSAVTAYAIGINPNIPGFGTLDVKNFQANAHYINTGGDNVQGYPESGYVLTSVGGRCTWNGPGRMLFKLQPDVNYGLSGLVGSKDHQYVCAGETFVYICEVKKQTN